MRDFIVLSAPGSAAPVAAIALEEIGAPYAFRPIYEHGVADRTKNASSLVSHERETGLTVDGETLRGDVAVLTYLIELFAGRLLPHGASAMQKARQVSDMALFAARLAPAISPLFEPVSLSSPETAPGIRLERANAAERLLSQVNRRIAGTWWYGEAWSIIDVLLYWGLRRAQHAELSMANLAQLCEHAERVETRAATQCALARPEVRACFNARPAQPDFHANQTVLNFNLMIGG